jgi:Flp pilus assembly protein TadD
MKHRGLTYWRGLAVSLTALALLSGCATEPKRDETYLMVRDADLAYQRGDWPAAEREYLAVIERVPQDPYALFMLGNTFARQQRFDEALVAYEHALKRDPGYAKAYNNMATIYLLKAEFALEAAIAKLPPTDSGVAQARYKLEELRKLASIPLNETRSPLGSVGTLHLRFGSRD